MLNKINELLENGISYEEISKQTGVDVETIKAIDESVDEVIEPIEVYGDYVNTQDESSIKRLYEPDELIDLSKEFSILLKEMKNKIFISSNKKIIYLGSDQVYIKFSKNGSLYFIVKNVYLRDYEVSLNLKTVLVEAQMRKVREVCELPRYIVEHHQSIFSGKEYVIWRNKSNERISIIMEYNKGIERLKEQMSNIEYRMLKEESQYAHHIEQEPTIPEKDEIYGDKQPEYFIEKTAELKETLQVLLELKNRKISSEEFELLREIQSEISNIIGE
jgi:hypothetical protein